MKPSPESIIHNVIFTNADTDNPITNVVFSAVDLADNSAVNIFTDQGFSGNKVSVKLHDIIAGKNYRLEIQATIGSEVFVEHLFINGVVA